MADTVRNIVGLGRPQNDNQPYMSTYRDLKNNNLYRQENFPRGNEWILLSSAGIDSVQAGTNVSIDYTDPSNPIISSTGGGSGFLPLIGGSMTGPISMGSNSITDSKVGEWDTAFGWGDHGAQGYLTSETDPIFIASAAANVIDSGGGTNFLADDGTYKSITPDGNGIYDGLGTIPAATVSTLTDTWSIMGGNVGINVAAPNAPLDVDGNIYQRSGKLFINSEITTYNSSDITFQMPSSKNIIFRGGNELMRIVDSTKSVGIGIALPTANLHVKTSTFGGGTTVFKVESNADLFTVKDDGEVNSRDGYWIGSNLFVHHGQATGGTIENTFIGRYSGENVDATGYNNAALGGRALREVTTGDSNAAFGHSAAPALTTGVGNTALGNSALLLLNGGQQFANTAVGQKAFFKLTSGQYNAGLGLEAGKFIESGQYNTMLGVQTGNLSLSARSYAIAIGANAIVEADHQMVVGSELAYIDEVYFGQGINHSTGSTFSRNFTIRNSNVPVGQTDQSNTGHFNIAAGVGTGSGSSADIIFKTAPSGSSGSTQNPLVEAMRVNSNGFISIGTVTATANLHVKTATFGGATDIFKLESNADILVAKDNGFVGVGTGTALGAEKLRVIGSTIIDDGNLTVQTTGDGNPAMITINGDKYNTNPDNDAVTSSLNMITDSAASPYGFNIDVLNAGGASKTVINHFKGGAGKVQVMYFDQSERVGIGTNTTLSALLQVTAKNAGTASVFLVERSTGADILRVTEDGKIGIGTGAAPLAELDLRGRFYMGNKTEPATPTGGGITYVQSGALKYKGSSGTVTTLGPA
jgi:hypothetical protein